MMANEDVAVCDNDGHDFIMLLLLGFCLSSTKLNSSIIYSKLFQLPIMLCLFLWYVD